MNRRRGVVTLKFTKSDNPYFSDETMSEPIRDAKTCVFWDVVGYPIPNRLDPLSIKENIQLVLANRGFLGDVSIQAYGNKNTFSNDELLSKLLHAGINIDLLPEGDKYSGIYSMTVDICLWALNNPAPSNLIVLSKNMDNVDVLDNFYALHIKHYGVVLSDAEPKWLSSNKKVAAVLLTSLFDGGIPGGLDKNKRKADTLADSEEDKSQGRPRLTTSSEDNS